MATRGDPPAGATKISPLLGAPAAVKRRALIAPLAEKSAQTATRSPAVSWATAGSSCNPWLPTFTWKSGPAAGGASARAGRAPRPRISGAQANKNLFMGSLRSMSGRRSREGVDVRAAPLVMKIIVIGTAVARDRVGHRDRIFDVGERPVVDPEVAVDRAAVEHLDQQLGIGRPEEPEGAAVAGERRGVAGLELARRGVPVLDRDVEPSAVQTELVRAGAARRGEALGEDPGAVTVLGH